MALVPNEAGVLAGLSAAQIYDSPAYALHRAQLESGPTAHMLEIASSCDLKPENLRFVGLGLGQSGDYALILRGPGVGRKEAWQCLAQRSQSDGGLGGLAPAFRLDEKASPPALITADAHAAGLVVDDSTVVICTPNWVAGVQAKISSKASAQLAPEFVNLLATVDRASSGWFVGNFPPGLPTSAGLERLGGTLQVGADVQARIFARFDQAEHAERALVEIREKLAAFASLAPAFGVPRSVVAAIATEQEGSEIRVAVPIGRAELVAMQDSLSRISRGPGQAPPLPAPTLGLHDGAEPSTDAAASGAADAVQERSQLAQ
jgi:hypothetical protein